MQTILGSGGVISRELESSLQTYTDNIRLVSRNPVAYGSSNELLSADLTNYLDAAEAIKGSDIVYLTVGLPYSLKAWKLQWPLVMRNVIDGCMKHNAKLVFFDNIYMYDRENLGDMVEETPVNPSSKKGEVRAEIAQMLLDEIAKGNITAQIARCADYYGPGIDRNAMLNETVIQNLSKGKTANWMGPLHFKHSFTYTPDAGKAIALLGNTLDTYNQIWHLPTAADPLTGSQWIDEFAQALHARPKSRVLTPFFASLLGIFIPVMTEVKEMMYQYDRDYVFNSKKFEDRFNFIPTSYQDGITKVVASDYPNQ